MNFTKELLKKQLRIDNRQLLEPRDYTIENTKYASTLCNSNTLIIVYHNIYQTTPLPHKPHQGIVRFHSNNKKLSKFVKKVYQNVIDLEALSISYGESCYEVIFDLQVVYTDSFPIIIDPINKIFEYVKKCFEINLFLFYEPLCYYYVKCEELVRDPTYMEQDKCDWECFIVMNGQEIVFVEKMKGECGIDDIIHLISLSNQIKV